MKNKVMQILRNESIFAFFGGLLGAVSGGFLLGGLGVAIGIGVGTSLGILRFWSEDSALGRSQ